MTAGYGIFPLVTVPTTGPGYSLALLLRADGAFTLEAWIWGSPAFELYADADMPKSSLKSELARVNLLVEASKALGEVAAEVAAGRMSGVSSCTSETVYESDWMEVKDGTDRVRHVIYIRATVCDVEYHFAFFTSEQGVANHVPFLVKSENKRDWPKLSELKTNGLEFWYHYPSA